MPPLLRRPGVHLDHAAVFAAMGDELVLGGLGCQHDIEGLLGITRCPDRVFAQQAGVLVVANVEETSLQLPPAAQALQWLSHAYPSKSHFPATLRPAPVVRRWRLFFVLSPPKGSFVC